MNFRNNHGQVSKVESKVKNYQTKKNRSAARTEWDIIRLRIFFVPPDDVWKCRLTAWDESVFLSVDLSGVWGCELTDPDEILGEK